MDLLLVSQDEAWPVRKIQSIWAFKGKMHGMVRISVNSMPFVLEY